MKWQVKSGHLFHPNNSIYSSRTEVISYCELRSTVTDMSADGLVKSLIWKILANLVKHNGVCTCSYNLTLLPPSLHTCLSVCLYIRLSICPSTCWLPVCLSVCLPVPICLFFISSSNHGNRKYRISLNFQ